LKNLVQIRPAHNVAVADVDGEAIVLNVTSGVYFGLNPMATRIWHLVSAGTTEDQVVQSLLAEFDVDEARLRTDVATTLQHLRANGLIDVVPA
jgi:hypothetical protein